jgi:YD repeat-containing protein
MFTMSTDFHLPGQVEVRWQRHYSTSATNDGWLGRKWMVPYFMTLERHADQYVLTGAHGESVPFTAPAGYLRRSEASINFTANMELRRGEQHYSVLHWHLDDEVTRFCFLDTGEDRLPLAWIEDLRRNRVRLEYDSLNRPIHVIQELEHRALEITYDRRDLVVAVHFLATGRPRLLVRYEYDDQRRLVSSWDALGHRKGYEYDHEHRMTVEINPLGSRFVFEYDRHGRCVRAAGADGYMERRLHYHPVRKMTRVADSQGAVTDYYLNPAGQVVQKVTALGSVTTNEFDEHGRLLAVIQPDGSKETYAYDDNGNRTVTVDPCGAVTTIEYDDRHVPTRMVDRNGYAWSLIGK